MKDTVHVMDLNTGESYQIGDEEKGVYSCPDISGDKMVYRFDEDFGSFLKDSAPQQLLMTDISTNETTVIASPGVRIRSNPKIDGENIVWSDKRNKKYSVWLYNINKVKDILISDTNEEYGSAVEISGDTVIWSDNENGRNILKMIKLDLPETSATVTETSQTTEGITGEAKSEGSPSQTAGLLSRLPVVAVIFGLCFIAKRTINNKK